MSDVCELDALDFGAASDGPADATLPMGRASDVVLCIRQQLLDLPIINTVLVIRKLAEKLPLEPENDGEREEALAAIRQFAGETGESSAPRYGAWQRRQPTPNNLPTLYQIKKLFRYWAAAKAKALGLPLPDPTARRLWSQGRAAEREAVIAAVQQWATTHTGLLIQDAFLDKCRDLNREATGDSPPLPVTESPIRRLFRNWTGLLEEAGLGDRRRAERPPAQKNKHRRYPRGRPKLFSDKDLCRWLRKLLLGTDLSPSTYVRARRAEAERGGDFVRIPARSTIEMRFGTWDEALRRAGLLQPGQQRAGQRASHGPYADDEIIDAVIEALQQYGMALSPAQYLRARLRSLPDHPDVPMPCIDVVLRLGDGDWEQAKRNARAARPDAAIPDHAVIADGVGRRSNRPGHYAREVIIDATIRGMREGGRRVRKRAFTKLRRKWLDATPDACIPGPDSIADRLADGVWDEALNVAASERPNGPTWTYRRSRPAESVEELRRAATRVPSARCRSRARCASAASA